MQGKNDNLKLNTQLIHHNTITNFYLVKHYSRKRDDIDDVLSIIIS
jgi:hypothetical protein